MDYSTAYTTLCTRFDRQQPRVLSAPTLTVRRTMKKLCYRKDCRTMHLAWQPQRADSKGSGRYPKIRPVVTSAFTTSLSVPTLSVRNAMMKSQYKVSQKHHFDTLNLSSPIL